MNQQSAAAGQVSSQSGRDLSKKQWHTPVLTVFRAEDAATGHSWNFDGNNNLVEGGQGHS
jgi:hypothetical protein